MSFLCWGMPELDPTEIQVGTQLRGVEGKNQIELYIVFVDLNPAFYRNCGRWEPGRRQAQTQCSTFNPIAAGVGGHKKRDFTLNASWAPGIPDLWDRCRCSRALGPSCPEAQDETWDKHPIITVILGICPDLLTCSDWAAFAAVSHKSAGFAAQQGLSSWWKNDPRPAWGQHGLLVFNLYTAQCHSARGRRVDPNVACPYEKDLPPWEIITWIFSNFKPNSKQESSCLPHRHLPFHLIFTAFSSAKYTIRQKCSRKRFFSRDQCCVIS